MRTRLEAPTSFKDATEEEVSQISNGCGPDGGGRLVPDFVLGLYVGQACVIHDWEYGTSDEPRTVVDSRFRRNLVAIVKKKGGLLEWPRLVIVWWYFRAVEKLGGNYYGKIQ